MASKIAEKRAHGLPYGLRTDRTSWAFTVACETFYVGAGYIVRNRQDVAAVMAQVAKLSLGTFSRRTLALLAVVGLPFTARAEEPAPAALFSRLDANADGQLTTDEVPAEKRGLLKRLLRKADVNQDGQLSREEFAAGLNAGRSVERQATAGDKGPGPGGFARPGPPPRAESSVVDLAAGPAAAAVYSALDKNGDGRLSADEIAAATDSLAALDKNGDGSISPDELAPNRPALTRPGADGPDPARLWQRLLAGDKNNDGKLSAEELPERLRRAFSRLDANGDGVVEQSELAGGLAKLRGAPGAPPGS